MRVTVVPLCVRRALPSRTVSIRLARPLRRIRKALMLRHLHPRPHNDYVDIGGTRFMKHEAVP